MQKIFRISENDGYYFLYFFAYDPPQAPENFDILLVYCQNVILIFFCKLFCISGGPEWALLFFVNVLHSKNAKKTG